MTLKTKWWPKPGEVKQITAKSHALSLKSKYSCQESCITNTCIFPQIMAYAKN